MARCVLANMLAALLVLVPLIAAQYQLPREVITVYETGHVDPSRVNHTYTFPIPAGVPSAFIDISKLRCDDVEMPSYLRIEVKDAGKDAIYVTDHGVTIGRPIYNTIAIVTIVKQCVGKHHPGKHGSPLAAA